MKRKIARHLMLALMITAIGLMPAQGQSFFDKLKKKAEEVVKDKATEAVNDSEKPGKGAAPSSASAKKASGPAAQDGAEDLPTSARKIARAVLNLAPAIFDSRPDHQLKQLVRIFYPGEDKIFANEFVWRKRKAEFRQNILAESKGAPATFTVAPWLNNRPSHLPLDKKIHNNLQIPVGRYDFDRGAWPIYVPAANAVRLPWINAYGSGAVGYQVSNMGPATTHWLPMAADKAEKLDQQFRGHYQLVGRYSFTVTDVIGVRPEDHPDYEKNKKYMKGAHKDKVIDKLTPVARVRIDDGKIDLYVLTASGVALGNATSPGDYRYVTTLHLDQL